jgi:hypothetical protein
MFVKVKQTQSRSCRAKVAEEEEVSRVNKVLVKKIHFMDFFHHLLCQRYHTSSPSEGGMQGRSDKQGYKAQARQGRSRDSRPLADQEGRMRGRLHG